ncbi:DNA polymerase III subunit beta [Megalodesulfovibrio gigas]|uniref:Beta sliding clamp n=1 Tax=Megalodesulfovibrio gigas (strain ATCC 19364 / DSM 1382 / NCIMB 9332 / VKM B-1759) TaxID=1121448 RepID=T2G9P2_MEGG1|nr:DNA polymerase III subunit beta [Megalodesulfovibrio gigas]AGW13003.1 putative DNA polymerase III subunit beta [Megalodesulfovibrio gigas DSM 1382 = ATCC 19364]
MKIRCFKDDIIDGLQKAAGIIPSKTGAAYLRTIWIKADDAAVTIYATDTSLEFTGKYPAEVLAPGLAGVQGKAFVDLVRKLPAGPLQLSLDSEGKTLSIEQGSRRYKLPTNDAQWFQNYTPYPAEGSVPWAGDFLQELLDRVAFCISDEDSMEAIACLSLKKAPLKPGQSAEDPELVVEICGLNGHQFAMIRFRNDEIHSLIPDEGLLLHRKYVQELRKWLAADAFELAIEDRRLFCQSGDGSETFSMPIASYQYPDYYNFLARLAGENTSRLTVNRQDLAESLDRLSIFNTETNRCAFFHFADKGTLTLTAQGQDIGSATEQLDVTYQGDLKKIAFPTKGLLEVLAHFTSKELAFVLTGAEGPCGVTGVDDPEYTVIIMPMKIVEETYYSEEEVR